MVEVSLGQVDLAQPRRDARRVVRLVDGKVVADESVPRPADAADLLVVKGRSP